MSKYSIETDSYINSLENNYYCSNRNGQDILMKLDEKHKDIIDSLLNNQTTIIVKGRQVGSTTLLTGFITEYLKRNVCNTCVVFGNNLGVSNHIIDEIKKHSENRHRTNNRIISNAQYFITYTNSSYICQKHKFTTTGKTKVDIMYISELAFFDDNQIKELREFYEFYKPSKVIVESTPNGKNYFKDFVSKNDKIDGRGVVFINYQETPTVHPNPHAWIKGLQTSLTREEFKKEILGKL